MRNALVFALAIISIILLGAANVRASVEDGAPAATPPVLTSVEAQRLSALQIRLCGVQELDCEYVKSIFGDPRLAIYQPPPPAPEQPSTRPSRERERNPYFTKRFGLLSPESLERCRLFVGAHAAALATAYDMYGVSKEVICAHLRIETNFGIPTKLSPNPLGKRSAVNQLVSLYVRSPSLRIPEARFVRRQDFAFGELSKLIAIGKSLDWDLLNVPGSPTGAIGLSQFEPSSFRVAVDGNGDGKIDLFDPDDAIVSIAHYLVTRGWNGNPEHQKRAIYAYYGGHYDQDPRKYYMKAVLKYASEVGAYLKEHPVESDRAPASL